MSWFTFTAGYSIRRGLLLAFSEDDGVPRVELIRESEGVVSELVLKDVGVETAKVVVFVARLDFEANRLHHAVKDAETDFGDGCFLILEEGANCRRGRVLSLHDETVARNLYASNATAHVF